MPEVLLLNHMEVGEMVRIKAITCHVWLTLSDKNDFTIGGNDEIRNSEWQKIGVATSS